MAFLGEPKNTSTRLFVLGRFNEPAVEMDDVFAARLGAG